MFSIKTALRTACLALIFGIVAGTTGAFASIAIARNQGILYTNGQREPLLRVDNASAYSVTLFFRGKKYWLERFHTLIIYE